MNQKKEKRLKIRSCLTGAIWLSLVFSTVISALLFAFLNHFFKLPGSIPVLGWLLIFNTLIAGLITSFINAKLLEPITRLSKAMKEVSQGDFEQHLEISTPIAMAILSLHSANRLSRIQPLPVHTSNSRHPGIICFFASSTSTSVSNLGISTLELTRNS